MRTAVDGADPRGQFGGREQAVGFEDLALAVQPLGLDGVEPGALDRQGAHEQPHAVAGLLDLLVVRAHPGADDLGVVPGGVIPHQQDSALPARLRLGRAPRQEVDRHRADRAPIDEAQPEFLAPLLRRVPGAGQEAVTGQGLGVGIVTRDRLFDQMQRPVVVLPGVQGGVGQPTPPNLVREAEQPVRVLLGQPDQAVAPSFLRAYSGSGLVIHSLARRQRTPMRASVARIVSSLTRVAVRPCS